MTRQGAVLVPSMVKLAMGLAATAGAEGESAPPHGGAPKESIDDVLARARENRGRPGWFQPEVGQ